jgi:outer membrane protein OmpA-like peptidoglycan-associated protein
LDATQAGNAEYASAEVEVQAFSIAAAPQTISFTSSQPAEAGVGDTYNAAASSSAGLDVSYTVDASSSDVCTVTGSVFTMTGLGTCVVDATQAGTADYFPALPQSQVIVVDSMSPLLLGASNNNQSNNQSPNANGENTQPPVNGGGSTTGGTSATSSVSTVTLVPVSSPISAFFGANSSAVSVASVMSVAKRIIATKSSVITITGYWDPSIDRGSSIALGFARATATKAALQKALAALGKKNVKFIVVDGGKLTNRKPASQNLRTSISLSNH